MHSSKNMGFTKQHICSLGVALLKTQLTLAAEPTRVRSMSRVGFNVGGVGGGSAASSPAALKGSIDG